MVAFKSQKDIMKRVIFSPAFQASVNGPNPSATEARSTWKSFLSIAIYIRDVKKPHPLTSIAMLAKAPVQTQLLC